MYTLLDNFYVVTFYLMLLTAWLVPIAVVYFLLRNVKVTKRIRRYFRVN